MFWLDLYERYIIVLVGGGSNERAKAAKCLKVLKGELTIFIKHVSQLQYSITNIYSPNNPELSKAWISNHPYLRSNKSIWCK
jgi:hypothetical protein